MAKGISTILGFRNFRRLSLTSVLSIFHGLISRILGWMGTRTFQAGGPSGAVLKWLGRIR